MSVGHEVVGYIIQPIICSSICVLLSWRVQVTLHQLLCDMGLLGYHERHVVGDTLSCRLKVLN